MVAGLGEGVVVEFGMDMVKILSILSFRVIGENLSKLRFLGFRWRLCFFAFKVSVISSSEQLLRMLLACIWKARHVRSSSRSRLIHGCSLRGCGKVNLLFTFSSPEHSTRLFLCSLFSASSLRLLLFPLNVCLCHYLYFCSKFYLLDREWKGLL